ncbi:MAG TPA: carboxypeptidase-like regulatory domain-containing protein [Nocardioides sp.]
MAAGALAAAALGVVSAAPANAAVMVSGSLIDSAGNYAEGTVYAVNTSGTTVGYDDVDNGAFDIPLDNGTYKLEFVSSDFVGEWYRDKADETTADVITVAGAAQTLAPWTVERAPHVSGIIRTADGRAVSNGQVTVYNASTGVPVKTVYTDGSGGFRVSTSVPSVKLQFSGWDRGESLATEYYNDKATLATADLVTPTSAGANLGVITLVPGGTISGRVTTEAGAPIHRARACADGDCDWTDANGVYTIEGVNTGDQVVRFEDPIGEFVGEYYNNVPLNNYAGATKVAVGPGQAVANVDAALAAAPVAAPNGVDLSGTGRDELGGLGVGYLVKAYDVAADLRTAKVVATTYSNRAGQYAFTDLDRIGGKSEFKIMVDGADESGDSGPREENDFARRTTWSGNKLDYGTATVVSAAPQTLDFTLPVAGGVSGAITSEAGGVPEYASVWFRNSDLVDSNSAAAELDGTYDERTLWAGDYTVRFTGYHHVSEWWKDALPEGATTITVKPGQMVTGISAALAKDVKALERPSVEGNAWVGKTIRLDAGRWNTQADSKITYEWLVGSTVVATGPSLKLTKAHLGKKVTGRVTNDAGFAQGQAVAKTTAKVGYKPKVKATVKGKKIALTIKAKPLKSKKTNASVVVYEVKGKRANGELKRKLLGKGKVKKGVGTATLKKPLGKGKHKLVLRIKGKGKVGSGDVMKVVKLKR